MDDSNTNHAGRSQERRPEPSARGRHFDAWLVLGGAGIGLLYGVGLRLLVRYAKHDYLVMTLGFIAFMPLVVGFLSVFFAEVKKAQRVWVWFVLPALPMITALVVMMLALLEGFICVAMFAPIGIAIASLGGVAGGVTARVIRTRRGRSATVACVVLLPALVVPWEKPAFYGFETRTVENVVDIHASPETVWQNIERVPAIRKSELPPSWSRSIGFPDPIEATLSHEGMGGVREASFERGVLFIETVDAWEPEQRLAFSIRADRIPRETLDEHVTVGGAYFDVLRGEYRLEPLANGVIRLHLSSRHRLSTDFNWYAHLWTDAVMSDLQTNILTVIRQRCEEAPRH